MASKTTVGLVGAGLGLLAGIGITAVYIILGDDRDTNVVLGAGGTGAPCAVVSKEAVVIGKRGHRVKWWVRDLTCGSNEVVSIGNFRTVETSSNSGCGSATEGGAVWPFDEDEALASRQANPGGKIDLRLKRDETLPGTYYFDLCTGSGEQQRKSDPRLVIDP